MEGYQRHEGEDAEAHCQRLLQILQQSHLGSSEGEDVEDEVKGGGLEEAEAILAAKSAEKQSPMVLELLKNLQQCAVYTDTPNSETNRKLWNAYAQSWSSDADFIQRMSQDVARTAKELNFVGEEWSDAASLNEVLKDWLLPHVPKKVVAEVGSGGGRVAAQVAGLVPRLVCFDISDVMLKRAQKTLKELGHGHVEYELLLADAPYPSRYQEIFEIVYSFDVFVHMDLHEMRHTLSCIHDILKPGGLFFVSFANLLAPDGWRRFARQKHYSVGGFYFISTDIAKCLLQRAGFSILKVSKPQKGNTYLNRDLLVLARRD